MLLNIIMAPNFQPKTRIKIVPQVTVRQDMMVGGGIKVALALNSQDFTSMARMLWVWESTGIL